MIEEIKVYATCDENTVDDKVSVWTISENPNDTGWETDSGANSYGLPKEKAEYYAKCINEHTTLLEQNKALVEALEYYANLHIYLYHDAQEGELYADWWKRQSEVALAALTTYKGEKTHD